MPVSMLLPRALAVLLVWYSCAEEPTVEQEFEVPAAAASTSGAPNQPNEPEDSKLSATAAHEAARGGLVEEWDKHMEGFTPECLLTFPLLPRTDEHFFEEVTSPVLIRGGFFASSREETSSVDFEIIDPHGDRIYEKSDQAEGLFHFIAKKQGMYSFVVSNHKWMQEKMVTFAIGKGNETALQTEHLDTMDGSLKAVERTLQDIQTESTYLWIRQKSHLKTVESIHRRVFWFCVVEFLVLLGISGFQVYYIKGLLSDRRVL